MPYAKKLRTFALVAAALLLLGTASASGAGKIGGNQIKKNAIASKHIKKNAVQTSDIKNNGVQSGDIKDGNVTSGDIKNGTVASGDLANGSVTAAKIAPGAVAFPNSLWGTMLRNQSGASESGVQAGPDGQPLGDGSLRLFTTGSTDVAAYGNSIDFAAFQLEDILDISYWTYTASPADRPSLRIEIDPHLVSDATPGGGFEFTTLVHVTTESQTGWVHHEEALDDDAWYLTGDEGTQTGCNEVTWCTFSGVVSALNASPDLDAAPPAISTGVYFGLGASNPTPTESAVDAFVFNDFQFDFEPMGVFLTPAP